MLVTLFGMVTLVRLIQSSKALSPIVVTPLGMLKVPTFPLGYVTKIVLFLLFWSDDDTVNHNCILVIKISPSRWPEHQLKHVGETIVNNIHHRILKCSLLVILVYIFWISIQCCHCDHTALHVTGPSDVGSCNNRF